MGETVEKAKENQEKEAKKAKDEAALEKEKAVEVAEKAKAKVEAEKAKAEMASPTKSDPPTACAQCKDKCKSESCKTWCDKHWCTSIAKQTSGHLEAATSSLKNAHISLDVQKAKQEAAQRENPAEKQEEEDIERAIQNGGDKKDMEKAKADAEAAEARH